VNGLADVMTGYFVVRRLSWRGEKEALCHWEREDPAFRQAFFACLSESDAARKLDLLAALVERCLAPAGPLWSAYEVPAADGVWESLISGEG
jgi:hypothetical protein